MNIRMSLFGLVFYCCVSNAQTTSYSVANAHAHNDYENAIPFYMAYEEGFGSIEADIFLENGELIVAHDNRELLLHRTLQEYYLQPLLLAVQRGNSFPYSDSTRALQMLIDIKTSALETLNKLITTLEAYPPLLKNPKLKWVITGNRPAQNLFINYPSFISFDGELSMDYSKEALTRIAMLSDNFRNYSHWDGQDRVPAKEGFMLRTSIDKAHRLHKPVRFWNSPDNPFAWKQFMRWGVDYINTDHVTALSLFLSELSLPRPYP